MDGADDRKPKLNIDISEQVSDSSGYIPAAYVAMHCVI
jgi:hypothetical protein